MNSRIVRPAYSEKKFKIPAAEAARGFPGNHDFLVALSSLVSGLSEEDKEVSVYAGAERIVFQGGFNALRRGLHRSFDQLCLGVDQVAAFCRLHGEVLDRQKVDSSGRCTYFLIRLGKKVHRDLSNLYVVQVWTSFLTMGMIGFPIETTRSIGRQIFPFTYKGYDTRVPARCCYFVIPESPAHSKQKTTGRMRPTVLNTKPSNYPRVQSILGEDFIMPEQVTKARPDIVYTNDQIAALDASLPSEDVLKWCKANDYAVIPAPSTPMSVLDIHNNQPNLFLDHPWEGWKGADFTHKFALEEKTSFGWLTIRKTLVPNSTSRIWAEQEKLLSAVEKVPSVAEMVWFITTYRKICGTTLFLGDPSVRTSSLGNDGRHVRIGSHHYFNELWFGEYDDSDSKYIGLSSARKL